MVPKLLIIETEMREVVKTTLRKESAKIIHLKLDGAVTERCLENVQSGYNLPRAPLWEALKGPYPEFHQKSLEWHAQSLGLDTSDELGTLMRLQAMITQRVLGKSGGGK